MARATSRWKPVTTMRSAQAALAGVAQEGVEVVQGHTQRALDPAFWLLGIALGVDAAGDQHQFGAGWQKRQGVEHEPVALRPLHRPDDHHGLRLRGDAELGADGRPLVEQVQAEIGEIDRVVNSIDATR